MGKLPYLTEKTEQKQRGFIIASEFGGPLDVTSWVAYKDNLDNLPNLYEGKLTYVYEDNQIYVYTKEGNVKKWKKFTNNVNIQGNTEFIIRFYIGNTDIPTNTVEDNVTHPDTEIQARLYVKTGEHYRRFGNTYDSIPSDDRRYNNDIEYLWYKNNTKNRLVKIQNTRDYKVNSIGDSIYFLSDNLYETGYLICIVKYKGEIVACNRVQYKNSQIDANDKLQGLYYLNSKSSMLQRGFLMTNEQGGGVDATTSVNSVNDLDGFTNNYLGKMVYSYQDDEYMYLASNEGARYTDSNISQEEKVKYVKEHTTGTWTPIGTIDVRNDVSVRWEITGRNYSKSNNGITKDDSSIVMPVINEEDWRPDQIQERYDNGQTAQYEAHLFIAPNPIFDSSGNIDPSSFIEVDRARIWEEMIYNDQNETGKVFYKWTVKKPEDNEYYDRDTDYHNGQPIEGTEDENRTAWIRDIDFTIDGGRWVNGVHKNGTIKSIDGTAFDFKNSPYTTNSDHANDDEEHHGFYGVEAYSRDTYTLSSNYMEIIYTNDYDQEDSRHYNRDCVDLVCTAYFKDENGKVRYIDSPLYHVSISRDHLVFVIDEGPGAGDTGIKSINPDQGKFVLDGGVAATINDFTLTNNEYKIGYGIMHYNNAATAAQGYYPLNHVNDDTSKGTLVYELYYNPENNQKVLNPISIFDLEEPTPNTTKDGAFDFIFHIKEGINSKLPFGWYKVFVFRRTYNDDVLYASTPIHYYQTITNNNSFVSPNNVWLGYHNIDDLNINHEYNATIGVNGTNLLNRSIPTIGDLEPKDSSGNLLPPNYNGILTQNYENSILYTPHASPNEQWIPCVNNDNYTNISAVKHYVDPHDATYPDTNSKNRQIEVKYYAENDQLLTFTDIITVNNVELPENIYNDDDVEFPIKEHYISSLYKWPDGSDIFIYGTDNYNTDINPIPYGVPTINSKTYSIIGQNTIKDYEDDSDNNTKIVDNFRTTLHGVSTDSNPKPMLQFHDTFEMIADVNNQANVITDQLTSITGRQFRPTIYDLKITIEQPSIQNDSDYYETNRPYLLKSHIWYRTSDDPNSQDSSWVEFTQEELGTVTYTWKERDGQDIFFSNVEELSNSKVATGTNTDGGYNNIYLSLYSDRLVFCYVQLNATVFGREISVIDEIKVRNPIDVLDVSHKIYTGNKNFKAYGLTDTRQLESEWIELTITPTLVDWFTWGDITTTLTFMIDGEVVDENSTKYTIEYDYDGRNHFYEGTFRVYYKVEDDMPDETFAHPISLNKRTNNYIIPVSLLHVNSINIYPLNHDRLNIGYPAIDNVFINAKVGTSQRYIFVIEGTGLDDDAQFLSITKKGFTETLAGAASIPGNTPETNIELDSNGFKKIQDTPTKIVYYINDSTTTNMLYTVTYHDADNTYVRTAKTYMYDDNSIKSFYTTSAYYTKNDIHDYVYLESRWINVHSIFNPTYTYIPVVVEKVVVDNTTKFTSSARYDLHDIGILSGDNILVNTKDDTKHVYTAEIARDYDRFNAVIKDFSTDVSSELPTTTDVIYAWQHVGPSIVQSPSDTMDKNYIVLYNDSDNDVNESINLDITILHHDIEFENWEYNTLGISDYVLNATADEVMPRLLYKIEFVKKNINLTIEKEYSMSDLFDSITTTMYRYDLNHVIERSTWTGSQLNDTNNNKLIFTSQNQGVKPSSIVNKKLTVTTDKGADIKVEWKRSGTDTKTSGNVSFTSDVLKTSISISPSSNSWDLKSVPSLDTTITIHGQNLKYGYERDGDSFLYVMEDNHNNHKLSFNPGITSNDENDYSYISHYTDTGHNLGYDDNNNPIDEESRTYKYYFGSNTATFTANYQNRKITNITFNNPCLITNKTYSKIAVPFNIAAVNMFGPDVDILSNDYDLTWSSTPAGSVISGTFTSSAGNAGTGELKIVDTILTDDVPVSITVSRELNSSTYNGNVNIARITGISSNSNETYVSDAKLTVTFTGVHMDCPDTTYYIAIKNAGTSTYTTLGQGFKPNAANKYTKTVDLPDRTTFNASVDRDIKVWMETGNVAGQYATHTLPAQNPQGLRIAVVSGSIRTDSVECNETTSTLYWKGNVDALYADGTEKRLVTNGDYSSGVSFTGTCCGQSDTNYDRPVSTVWQLAAGTYNSATASNAVTVNGTVVQKKDSIDSVTYGPTSCSPSSLSAAGGTVTLTATKYINWKRGAQQSTTVTNTRSVNNKYNESSTTKTLTADWGGTCNVSLSADTYSCSTSYTSVSHSYSQSNCLNPDNHMNVPATANGSNVCKWSSDGSTKSSTSVSTPITFNIGSNYGTTSKKSYNLTYGAASYTVWQCGDVCQDCNLSGGSISVRNNMTEYTPDGSTTRILDVTGRSCTKTWQYGGTSCGTKTGDTSCEVSPSCNAPTQYCGGLSYTFNMPPGLNSLKCDIAPKVHISGTSYVFSVGRTSAFTAKDACGNSTAPGAIDQLLASGSVRVSISVSGSTSGGYVSYPLDENITWTGGPYSGGYGQSVSISIDGGSGTTKGGNHITFVGTGSASGTLGGGGDTPTPSEGCSCVKISYTQVSSAGGYPINGYTVNTEECSKQHQLTYMTTTGETGTRTVNAGTEYGYQQSQGSDWIYRSLSCKS